MPIMLCHGNVACVSSVWRPYIVCLAGMRGDRKPTEENPVYSQDKTRGGACSIRTSIQNCHSILIAIILLIFVTFCLTCHASFLLFSKSDLHSFSFSSASPPPPFQSSSSYFSSLPLSPLGNFSIFFEVSVDIQIKPLWSTRSSATCRQSI